MNLLDRDSSQDAYLNFQNEGRQSSIQAVIIDMQLSFFLMNTI